MKSITYKHQFSSFGFFDSLWVDQKIPALEGKSLRKAVKTSDGRESLEALLIQTERQFRPDDQMAEVNRSALKKVHRKLVLN